MNPDATADLIPRPKPENQKKAANEIQVETFLESV
jgi:hypothetical protein